ncbi:MAG: iron-containing alcohol dehydrogenase [Desulfotignum sp.]|nr:iron-containing alcohol dehydrogenase [Desulfotignum sp.]
MTDLSHFLCRTKTAFGAHALSHLPFDLSGMDACKPFVITDQPARDAGLHNLLTAAFKDSDMALGITTLTDFDDIEPLYHLFVDKGYDSILALGTGPVVRTAKRLNLAVCMGPEILRSDAGPQQINRPLLPLAFIPTLPSDGCETTMTLVLDRFFVSPFLSADLAVVTPEAMLGAPDNRILDAGLTSLAVCCQAFVLSGSPLVRPHAATGIRLVMDTLLPLIQPPGQDELLCQKAKKNRQLPLAKLTLASVLSGYIRSHIPDLNTYLIQVSGMDMALALIPMLDTCKGASPWPGKLLLPLTDPDRYTAVPGHLRPEAAIQTIQQLVRDLSWTLPEEVSHGDA